MTATPRQPAQCGATYGDTRCDRPRHNGGHHRANYHDETGRTGIRSWTDRTTT